MNQIKLHHYRPKTNDNIPIQLLLLEALPARALVPEPNRHNFHEIFWVTAGRGKHHIDFVQYDIRPNTFFFVKQGCVHYWEIEEPLQGYVLLFQSDVLFANDNIDFPSRLDLLRTGSTSPTIYPTVAEVAWFQELWQRIAHEYNRKRLGRDQAILALLRLLLIEAARITISEAELPVTLSASVKLAYQYQQLVEQNAIRQHKVAWYANQLAVTVPYLSKSVRRALGTRAGELLRNRILLEAKRLVVHTNETAEAIALQLCFEDASYFGRFFKRETQQTPHQFRAQFPIKYQQPSLK